MDELSYQRNLDELDRMLNDPNSNMDPDRVWALLADISHHDLDAPEQEGAAAG